MKRPFMRYFVAHDVLEVGPHVPGDLDTCACGKRHPGLAAAFLCAKRLGLATVWSVEVRGPLVVPRARSRVRR